MVCGFLGKSSTITTTATSTTTVTVTATAERFFEALRVYGSSTTTTTATSTTSTTATATTERLFEALRVYYLVILSTDRGLVVLRFCGGAKELSTRKALRVNNVDYKGAEEFFIRGDEELRGSTIYLAFLLWIEVL